MDYETDVYGDYLTHQVELSEVRCELSELKTRIAYLEKENEELKKLLKEVHISSHGRYPTYGLQLELDLEDALK